MLSHLAKLPQRTWRSMQHWFNPAFAIQRRADRYVPAQLDAALIARLENVPGTSSSRQCRLLFYLADTVQAQGCVLEVGSLKGKSTAWLFQAAQRCGRHLVSIDPHVNEKHHVAFCQTVEQFGIDKGATIHRAFSHEIGKDWRDPIAFLWIDGGHDYDSVRHDIDDFTPHLQPGGFVVFDDVNPERFPGVVQALDETLRRDAAFQRVGKIKSFEIYRRRAS